MTLQPHDITYAVSQLRDIMFEFWLGAAMISFGFAGFTTWSYSMLCNLRKTVPASRQWRSRHDR